ncbi:holo-ACP synthase [Luteolibacter flavescens]|uniref:Holo-[acyl-carrier-protein] synthase n=1 Tax=Luteolibacter flavescens TaxID=1859460 RepID=A0ABT3FKA8_9BACT|nr:holo-ACP synthase [Luteolibacter flavescens]MCW1883435.1 holo-ACP synthase [Luteolibacter flavescens]
MKLFGIGIDVVEVERIESSMAEFGERFAIKIFTEGERAYCSSQKRPAIHYAARFAAKEAVAKAFGTGIGKDLGWLDMEIVRKDSGEPELVLSGVGMAYAKQKGIAEVKISLTHAQHYAAANAVALGE